MDAALPFTQIAAVLALAAGLGILGLLLKQPLIVAFIATGVIAGPDVLDLLESADQVRLLAEIGVAVLLFLVGLKLDLHIVRSLGPVALATGLGQVVFTAIVGFVICLLLGIDATASAYVAVALTFSSTIIIVKLLSDKREVDSLHGRIAIGFLIVQDIAVVIAMIVLSAFGIGAATSSVEAAVLTTIGGSVALLGVIGVFMRFAAEGLLRRVARVPELLVTFALAWAVLFAAISDFIGLGKELGGLLAGVSLASTSFRDAIASRLSSLRDFLLLFFFISLGSGMRLGTLGDQIPAALTLSAFVLIGNPLIVLIIMGFLGYRKRTGFLAGLTVAQISEFSLIFMAMGITLGHVSESAMALVTLVGLVTITLSTYMILYSHTLYRFAEPFIGVFERRAAHREEDSPPEPMARHEAILFGLGRYGLEIADVLQNAGVRPFGVDFDPETLRHWTDRGLPGMYGDAADPDLIASLPLAKARWAIIAMPPAATSLTHSDPRLVLAEALRQAGFGGKIVMRSHDPLETDRLRQAGADIVLSPFADAAVRAGEYLGIHPDPE
jgi:Kef-type K+ transport system membrane component KefB